MGQRGEESGEARGLSAGALVFLFLIGVAVCAAFFSAGYLVGYNERASKAAPLAEQVTPAGEVPPLVGQEAPSASTASASPKTAEQPATTPETGPPPLRPQPLSSATKQASETQPKPGAAPETQAIAATPEEAARSKAGASEQSPTAGSRQPAGEAGSSFIIQVAATGTKPDADKMVAALKNLDYPVVLVTPEQAHTGDNLYRVQVGPFATRESAERVRTRLMLDGFKQPFIKH